MSLPACNSTITLSEIKLLAIQRQMSLSESRHVGYPPSENHVYKTDLALGPFQKNVA